MANTKAFQKILSFREREKNEAQIAYKQSVESFEDVATQLYNLLRKKEDVENKYNYYLETMGSVTNIATHYSYIERIKEKITRLETSVNEARHVMDAKQLKLTNAHIETKKYEKLIERKKLKLKEHELEQENKLMDETSIIQFLNNRDR
ncbi:flagellar export protein FliJ [Aquibacillus rhizosphaerae]|uniref:Flagellar FliJ protein n=1 Tax=Aquibacillus rhizosphaerae TaxID=3051431 RepID=A0ABT7L2G9_9BACI|nr:flagellar export protein FliJ [Aquibacillus sp. LR5S19]MDL4840063.1 flagellar export protein FliJ [Aquibacillus sp. LR5S19]